MKGAHLFYKYYDVLYSGKNYRTEADYVFKAAKKHARVPVKKVLEIGCGTGNHSLELAKSGITLTAIDTDAHMLARAIEKNKPGSIRFLHTPVEKLHEKNFGLVLALFNVITYLPDTGALLSFFNGVNKRMKKGGLFIFDCWNGLAALADPPGSKIIHKFSNDEKIYCRITNKTDLWKQKTILSYNIEIKNRKTKKTSKGIFSFAQTLWTPRQIEDCLSLCNFSIIKCNQFFSDKPAGPADWKIMYLCKK